MGSKRSTGYRETKDRQRTPYTKRRVSQTTSRSWHLQASRPIISQISPARFLRLTVHEGEALSNSNFSLQLPVEGARLQLELNSVSL